MKIQIKKIRSPYNKDFVEIQARAEADGPKLRDILEALKAFKDQETLKKCFEAKMVSAWAKIGTRFHPLGNIPFEMYNQFLKQS